MIKEKVCPKCGTDTYVQADLSWDSFKQDWVVAWTNTEIYCAKCGHTYKITDCKNIEG